MFTLGTLLFFIGGAMALIASPGPDFLYVLSRGIAGGPRAGVLSACGIALGLLVHTTLAVAGLTALLRESATAFNVVKWAGAAYLIYLGVKTLRSGGELHAPDAQFVFVPRRVLWQGFLTNVLNVKAALTFATFLPQFVRPHRSDAALQIGVLGLMMVVMSLGWFSFVGCSAAGVGAWLRGRPHIADRVRVITGSFFVLLGVRLAFVRH